MSKLFKEITDINNIEDAYKQSQKGKGKYKSQSLTFEMNVTDNLLKIKDELENLTYDFSGYNRFTVYEPKERIIDAPCLKDKIVQLSINNKIKKICNPTFIYDSYACIDEKGTHKAVYRIQHFLRKAYWLYSEDATIIKIDLKKFFYSIDRDITKREFAKNIDCDDTLKVIYKIVDSAKQISEKGLPLGNTLSQIGANLTINPLDQYAKRKLGLKFYVRYADDIIVVVKSKDEAKRYLKLLKEFIENELNLVVNENKTKIFPIEQGVNALGYKIYRTHMLLRNESKKRIKRKLKKMENLIEIGKMRPEKAEQMLNSWKGHADYSCSYNFINSLLEKHDYIKMDNGNFKIILKEGDK